MISLILTISCMMVFIALMFEVIIATLFSVVTTELITLMIVQTIAVIALLISALLTYEKGY